MQENNSKFFLGNKKSKYKYLFNTYFGYFFLFITGTFLLWFNNCGQVYKAKQQTQISSACNQIKIVSDEELSSLIENNHKVDQKGSRIRCPGFFAVLDDDATFSKAQQKASNSNKDNCNENGLPKEPDSPTIDAIKDQLIRKLMPLVNLQNISNSVKEMSNSSLWPTRYHQSSYRNQVAEWIQSEFQKNSNNRSDVHIKLVPHQNTPQSSVEIMIDGHGSNKNKYVVLGGHEDSIEIYNSRNSPDSQSPGADDNASGVSVLLEAFRVLMLNNYQPDATVVFYTYAAEEVGLVGSQEIARSYANENKEVLGVMQIDMAMFSTNDKNNLLLISDFTSSTMNKLAENLIKEYLKFDVKYMACGYACSDHASWTKYNYPSFIPAESEIKTSIDRIHTINDIVDNSTDASYAAHFSHLAIAFAISMAGVVQP